MIVRPRTLQLAAQSQVQRLSVDRMGPLGPFDLPGCSDYGGRWEQFREGNDYFVAIGGSLSRISPAGLINYPTYHPAGLFIMVRTTIGIAIGQVTLVLTVDK